MKNENNKKRWNNCRIQPRKNQKCNKKANNDVGRKEKKATNEEIEEIIKYIEELQKKNISRRYSRHNRTKIDGNRKI